MQRSFDRYISISRLGYGAVDCPCAQITRGSLNATTNQSLRRLIGKTGSDGPPGTPPPVDCRS
ncbi:hypothetical protein GLOTRDRAFT_100463, partial [Gloeophyllum trabeum ATCC 11539]